MIDLLVVDADHVVTVDRRRRILTGGAIAVQGGRIVAIGKTATVRRRFPDARKVISARRKLVMPGMVEAHIHHTQHLARGLGDNLSVRQWLLQLAYPFESVITAEEALVSSLHCQLEMIRGGATCFIDVGNYFPAELARATEQSGMRGVFTRSTYDLGQTDFGRLPKRRFTQTTREALRDAERVVRDWNGAVGGRLRAGVSLRIPTNCSDALCFGVKRLADRYGVLIQSHVASIYETFSSSVVQFGEPEIERFERLGVLGPRWLMIHMGWVTPRELVLLRKHDVKVAHCPGTTMHLGYGCISHGSFPEMVEMGITVGLGSDASTAAGFVNATRSLYLAANSHRDARMNARLMPPETVVEMATINGARCALWEDKIGSLDEGKRADLVIYDTDRPEWVPRFNPLFNLVHSAEAAHVDTVVCDGKVLMEGGKVLTIDERALLAESERLARRVLKRAGLTHLVRGRWPIL